MNDILTSLRLTALSMFVCCVLYTGVLLGIGRVCAPWQSEGSMIRNKEGQIIGSALIAQKFERPEYFWPRPSAVDYNASATGGSNLSPTNPKVAERAEALIKQYGLQDGQLIPADLVSTSGSGMDPHITLEAAYFQAGRVAAARHLSIESVSQLIHENTVETSVERLGGKGVVHVLQLNMALDASPK